MLRQYKTKNMSFLSSHQQTFANRSRHGLQAWVRKWRVQSLHREHSQSTRPPWLSWTLKQSTVHRELNWTRHISYDCFNKREKNQNAKVFSLSVRVLQVRLMSFQLQMNSIASENCFLSWKYLSPSALEVINLFFENCMSVLTFHFSSGFKSNEFRQLYNLLLARELL